MWNSIVSVPFHLLLISKPLSAVDLIETISTPFPFVPVFVLVCKLTFCIITPADVSYFE